MYLSRILASNITLQVASLPTQTEQAFHSCRECLRCYLRLSDLRYTRLPTLYSLAICFIIPFKSLILAACAYRSIYLRSVLVIHLTHQLMSPLYRSFHRLIPPLHVGGQYCIDPIWSLLHYTALSFDWFSIKVSTGNSLITDMTHIWPSNNVFIIPFVPSSDYAIGLRRQYWVDSSCIMLHYTALSFDWLRTKESTGNRRTVDHSISDPPTNVSIISLVPSSDSAITCWRAILHRSHLIIASLYRSFIRLIQHQGIDW